MLTYLSLKLPRNVEVTEEASKTLLAALKDINYVLIIVACTNKDQFATRLYKAEN